jgi:hypothetical protein
MTQINKIGDQGAPSKLRPITDKGKFTEAVQKVQRGLKSQYGSEVPYAKVAKWIQGDQSEPISFKVRAPTLAKQDLDFQEEFQGRQQNEIERANSEGEKIAREQIAEEGRQHDELLTARTDEFASRLGLDRDVFMEGVRQFNTNDMRALNRFIKEHNLDLKLFEEQVRQYNETSEEGTRQFNVEFEQRKQEHADALGIDLRDFGEMTRQYDLGRQDQIFQWTSQYNLEVRQVNELVRQYDLGRQDQINQWVKEFNLKSSQVEEMMRQFDLGRQDQINQWAKGYNLDLEKVAEAGRQYDLGRQDQNNQWAKEYNLEIKQVQELTRQYDLGRQDQINQWVKEYNLDYGTASEQIRQYEQNRTDQMNQWEDSMGIERGKLQALFDELEMKERVADKQIESDETTTTQRLTADEKRAKDAQESESWRAFIGGGLTLLGTVATTVITNRYFTSQTGSNNAMADGADILLGKNQQASWYKERFPELTDEQAEAWAANARKTTVTPTGSGGAPNAEIGIGDEDTLRDPRGRELTSHIGDDEATGAGAGADGAGDGSGAGEGVVIGGVPGEGGIVTGGYGPTNVNIDQSPASWSQMKKDFQNLKPIEMLEMSLGAGTGFLAEMGFSDMGGVQGGISRLMSFIPQIIMKMPGPMLGAYAAGILAHGVYAAFFGKGDRPDHTFRFEAPAFRGATDLRPSEARQDHRFEKAKDADGVSTTMSGTGGSGSFSSDDPGPMVGEADFYIIDWHLGEWDPENSAPGELPPAPSVNWYNRGGTANGNDLLVWEEDLTTYVERTNIVPMNFRGMRDQLYGELPEEVKQQLTKAGFKPAYVFKNADGSITMHDSGSVSGSNRGVTYKSIVIEPEDVKRYGLGGSVAPAATGVNYEDDPNARDGRGQGSEDALRKRAVEISNGNLSEDEITLMTSTIREEPRRTAFLKKLANAEPFSQSDVDYIFKSPTKGVYAYHNAWETFDQLVKDGKITLKRDIGA